VSDKGGQVIEILPEELFPDEVEMLTDSVSEALTGWRGTKPGHPGKGNVTKRKYQEEKAKGGVVAAFDEQQKSDPLDLFNAQDPSVPILKESPEHRMLAYMRARGMSRKEIFTQLGGTYDLDRKPISGSGKFSYAHIGNILKQPWFRSQVIKLQHEAGMDMVEVAIRAEMPSAVEIIVEIMNDDEAPSTARLAAASQILDRGLGKPVQRVENTQKGNIDHVLHDARELDRKLEQTRQELKQLGVG